MPRRDQTRAREREAPHRAISSSDTDFAVLFDEYYVQIATYLRRRQVDRSAAEDIAALTFVEATSGEQPTTGRREIRAPGSLGSPPTSCVTIFRSEHRQLQAYARTASRQVEPPDDSDEACSRLDARAQAGMIAAALATLSRGDYEVLTLHCWAELSHQEIAIALGIPEGTVKSRLSRARYKVRGHPASSDPGAHDG